MPSLEGKGASSADIILELKSRRFQGIPNSSLPTNEKCEFFFTFDLNNVSLNFQIWPSFYLQTGINDTYLGRR